MADEKSHEQYDARQGSEDDTKLLGATSPGVRRIEALAKHISFPTRIVLFITIILLAYCYTLDNVLRYAYQPTATASYSTHSLLATVAVLRAVIGAAAQPTFAKIADVFGRVELVLVTIIFYVVGTIIETFASEVHRFAAGAVLFQIGWTGISFLVTVIISDITSTRSRLFFSQMPNAPYLINPWVSGNISQAVLDNTSWNWGIGMWAIIYPIAAIPFVATLWWAHRKAKKHDNLANYKTPYQAYGPGKLLVALFWQLDVIGLILIIAALACILVPFTLAETQGWDEAHIIAPLVVGVLCVPAFILWELKAAHPLVPFHLLKARGIWAPLLLAILYNMIWYLQGDFLYTVAVVGFNQSILSATRINSLFNFVSVLTAIITGCVVFYVRRLKPFIAFGTMLYMVSFGLLIYYRGGSDSPQVSGLIGAQVLLGIAGGLFPYTGLASIQTTTQHEHLAIVTGLYLATYNIGAAFGNAASGAIWRNTLPQALKTQIGAVSNNATLAGLTYGDPFTSAAEYAAGTPERTAIIAAYRITQRYLTITGLCLCVPLIVVALLIPNPRLTDTQSLPQAEKTTDDGLEPGRV